MAWTARLDPGEGRKPYTLKWNDGPDGWPAEVLSVMLGDARADAHVETSPTGPSVLRPDQEVTVVAWLRDLGATFTGDLPAVPTPAGAGRIVY